MAENIPPVGSAPPPPATAAAKNPASTSSASVPSSTSSSATVTAAASTPTTQSATNAAENPSDEMAPLTNAQKKAKAKADKAARRSQTVASKVMPAPQAAAAAKSPKKSSYATSGPPPVATAAQKPEGPAIPDGYKHMAIAKRIQLSEASKDVHPVVLAIGQQMSSFKLKDPAARIEAMLVAFLKVMDSFETPNGQTFIRLLQNQGLNPQIEYLINCRPMCFGMGNAVRMLKAKIAQLIELNVPDDEARQTLRSFVEMYIQERITDAEDSIVTKAATIIRDGDHVLTYGHARLVQLAFQRAHAEGRSFQVVIADDSWEPAGEELAKILTADGIKVKYFPEMFLGSHMKKINKVMLGAEAMFANGALYAAAGTAYLALEAKDRDVPVIVLMETVHCDRERVSIDSLTYNEIDPEACTADMFRLLFDTTPGKDIDVVLTESDEANASGASGSILSALKRLDERLANN